MKPTLLILCIALSVTSCAGRRLPAAGPPPELTAMAAGPLRVGTARIDITPPPGLATFGHGPDAHVTNGYWTRLYCRAFVIETSKQERLVIVPCDLAAISVLLHREIAQRVTDIVPASHLMVTATHTHAGPAHYFESAAYTGVLSTRVPGFDPNMVDFLANRIAEGIQNASRDLRPARAHWQHANEFCLTRNRSLLAHRSDPIASSLQLPDDLPCAPLNDEQRAIDPALNVLQFEATDASGKELAGPIGWLVFFAMHPTVLPNTNRLLGADAFGVASRAIEAELRRAWHGCSAPNTNDKDCATPPDPLAGIINTNEGDMSPVWSVGNVDETIKVGRALATAAWNTYDPGAKFERNIVVSSRYLEVDLPEAETSTGMALCKESEYGAGAGHGASDHPTSVDAFLAGGTDVDRTRTDCQRPKATLLGKLQPILIGGKPTRFPEHVSFSLVRIDDTYVSFVPAEMTINAGKRVNRAVLGVVDPAGDAHAVAVIAGLANGYMVYVASYPEYQMQRYEGASTLYGPNTGLFIADRARLLAMSMVGQHIGPPAFHSYEIGQVAGVPYELGPQRARFEQPRGEPLKDVSARAGRVTCRLPFLPRPSYCFAWIDGAPGAVNIEHAPWLELIDGTGKVTHPCQTGAPLGSSTACDPGATIDDRGIDFSTRVHGEFKDGWFWSTAFVPSAAEYEWLQKKTGMRIRVHGGEGATDLESAVLDGEVPVCSDDLVRTCLE